LKLEHDTPEWLAAIEALILVAEMNGPAMFARIGMMRALNQDRAGSDATPRCKRVKAYSIVR